MSAPQPLDAFGLLRTLCRHDVEFVVIGGFSLAAHGHARATLDIDIVPAPDRPNLERLLAALDALKAEPLELGDFRLDELPVTLDIDGLGQGGNWALRQPSSVGSTSCSSFPGSRATGASEPGRSQSSLQRSANPCGSRAETT